jgi:hypothetical protein
MIGNEDICYDFGFSFEAEWMHCTYFACVVSSVLTLLLWDRAIMSHMTV